MKKSTILRLCFALSVLFIAGISAFAQNEVAQPGAFIQHPGTGVNSIDSVTVGGSLQYWAQPDASVAGTNSTFSWTVAPAALGAQSAGTPTNLATITFGANPTLGTISVVETSPNGCAGSTTTIDVRSIAAPNVTGGSAAAVACPSTASPYNMNVPTITLAGVSTSVLNNGNQGVQITYTLTGPTDDIGTSGTIGSAGTVLALTEGSATPVLDLSALNGLVDYPGTYTLTISNITDRISRKSGVNNNPNVTITFTVNRRPTTGPIFHLAN